MSKMVPTDHDTQLIYKCPDCECEHWKTLEEVKLPNQVFMCECGYRADMVQISKVTANVKFAGPSIAAGEKSHPLVPAKTISYLDGARETIKAQGYTYREADELVQRALKHCPMSQGELIRLALAGALD